MPVTVPLSAEEEHKLIAQAKARGVSVDVLVRNAVLDIITAAESVEGNKRPKPSLLGIWSQYGPGPTEADIDENRADMFSTFERDDIA